MFRIAVPTWNTERYIAKSLSSVLIQKENNYTCCVVVDPSTDKTDYIVKETIGKDPRFKIITNGVQKYALANIIDSINYQSPEDDDIIVLLDGDDWLINDNVLSIIKGYYDRDPSLLVTHGSWVAYPNPNAITNNAPYTEEDFRNNIRKVSWRASHLRTFKYKVWKKIKDSDFRDENNNYFRSAWDLAIMWPILEMATYKRVKFVPDILYVYNQETPYGDGHMRLREQMYLTDYIAGMKPYDPI